MRRLAVALTALALLAGCAGTPKDGIRRYPQGRFKQDTYVVQRGETLSDVARKFDVSIADLKKANRLSSSALSEGQRLVIPDGRSGDFTDEKEARHKKVRPPAGGKAPALESALLWPVKGSVTSNFGIRRSGKHDGIDIAAPSGTPIMAAADGTVIFSGWGPSGYGNIVVIRHSDALVTVYAHNKENMVERGAAVKRGDTIAAVGDSGRATTTHCHFEIRINRIPYDPLIYLDKR